jgi:hypothetical protein
LTTKMAWGSSHSSTEGSLCPCTRRDTHTARKTPLTTSFPPRTRELFCSTLRLHLELALRRASVLVFLFSFLGFPRPPRLECAHDDGLQLPRTLLSRRGVCCPRGVTSASEREGSEPQDFKKVVESFANLRRTLRAINKLPRGENLIPRYTTVNLPAPQSHSCLILS